MAWLCGVAACDTAITGTATENEPPETYLSVRDTSLVDNLAGADRLTSTVQVSWSGTDADGFVARYEVRYYATSEQGAIGPDAGWFGTSRLDTLILLPIEAGSSEADVVFEVRAVDNEDARDPSPARTVFPIRNSPPDLRLTTFELPPEETFTVFSFSWRARDPEGEANLARIEVSLNDSTRWVTLPPDVDFATFVGQIDKQDRTQIETTARVFTGRAFQSTSITVPGLLLNALNTFYVRAVDRTDTTSAIQSHTWRVAKPTGDVLVVNDYRKEFAPTVTGYHLRLLRNYLPEGTPIDVWDLSQPYLSGSTGSSFRSEQLPAVADPTIRHTLTLYRYVYWISTNTTNAIAGNNLPLVASAADLFFQNGGKMMIHSPVSLPDVEEENEGNPAILLMPLTRLVSFPDSLRNSLRLPTNATIAPEAEVPGMGRSLPALASTRLLVTTLPYEATGASIPLYRADYRYVTKEGRQGPWTGVSTVASITADRRVALFALPLADERTGLDVFRGVDNADGARDAMFLILESLGFPKR